MSEKTPKLILRMGTHAEKDYFEKTIGLLDGIIVGANLVESTPGATASLLVKFAGAKHKKAYYIDPLSYAFGSYIDPATGSTNSDLSWIKSEQKVKKETVVDYKRSYKRLGAEFGGLFSSALAESKAITPASLTEDLIAPMCESFKRYQLERVRSVFENDEKYKEFVDELPNPGAIFAPYFYVDPPKSEEWLAVNLKLIAKMAEISREGDVEAHAIICVDRGMLVRPEFSTWMMQVMETGIKGVWFWFSKFYEEDASEEELKSYRSLIETCSNKGLKVFSLHGGFFSLAMSKYGLDGISHGVGYGEQKDVVPIIGQSTPTVRYYLPSLYRRLSVPDIERCFGNLGIATPSDFRNKVCGCAICAGVVATSIDEFSQFGEMHYSREESKRQAQTPAAAKRCRFHFILARIIEREWLKKASVDQIKKRIDDATKSWGAEVPLRASATHLKKWINIL